jgi:hypothetical protein
MAVIVNCPCLGCGRDTFHVGRICSECGEAVPVFQVARRSEAVHDVRSARQKHTDRLRGVMAAQAEGARATRGTHHARPRGPSTYRRLPD